MKHLKRKLMMTLALLLTAATSAWAESKPIGLNVEYAAGDVITTNSTGDVYVWWGIYSEGGENYEWFIKISSSVTPTISELRIVESSGSIKLDNDYALYDMNGNQAASSYIIQCQGKVTGTTLEKVYVASGSGTLTDPYVFAPGPAAPAATTVPLTWDAATPKTATLTNGMPAGNVTVSVEYFPQATMLDGAVTAATDVKATTDDALVTIDKSKLTGVAKLMYFVSTDAEATAPAYTAEGWTDQVPTAENYTDAGDVKVWYYAVGTDEGVGEATATYSDGDMNAEPLTVTLAAAPLWNAEFDLTNAPEEDKAPGVWSTDIPEGGVVKGTPVKVTYTGSKKVIGVKAEKKAKAPASTPLDNTTTAWTAGTFAVPAGGLTYSDAITVSGDVTLTLTDGETLTLNKGISLAEGATLTIQGNGTMNVNGTDGNTSSTVGGNHGTLILTSGTLTATGGNGASVEEFTDDSHVGNGGDAINGSVIVSGGTLTARGGNGGSVGDYCENCSGGNGGDAISGTLTINGGSTSVNDGSNGSIGDYCGNCTAGAGGKAVAGTVTDNR